MISGRKVPASPADRLGDPAPNRKLTFDGGGEFEAELRRRVDEYFRSTGQRRRDCPQMYVKSAVILTTFAASYLVLVFLAQAWWQVLPLAILLGLATAAIGLNIQHDGSHHAYSDHTWINRLTAMSLDLIGASSYFWRGKHVVFHHTYTNIEAHDTDIDDVGVLGRLTPHQRRLWFHRGQHVYLWPIYGFMTIRWHFYGDFRDIITGRVGGRPFPRPHGLNLVVFLAGKAVFVALAFVIPLLRHSLWQVALFYGVTAFVTGLVLSVVFQLAHVVPEASFPLPEADTQRMPTAWAVHQAVTTVDFSRRSLMLTWLLGGLNHQIEHHLFPRICHIHYPALSRLVEKTCQDFGVHYAEHRTFRAGVVSHFRWLREMGVTAITTTNGERWRERVFLVPPNA